MLAIITGAAGTHASEHFVIVADLAHTRDDVAVIDVASDQAPLFQYDVLPCTSPPGATVCEGMVPFDPDRAIGSTPDVFSLTGASAPLMVRVATVDALGEEMGVPSQAVLRQNKQIMYIPPIEKVAGTQFAVPIADLGQGASLLIGNPTTNASDCSVMVFSMTKTYGTYYLPLGGVVSVPITEAPARVFVFSLTGVQVIAQLAILGKGKEFTMTMLERLVP
jgi:hypothetical protein